MGSTHRGGGVCLSRKGGEGSKLEMECRVCIFTARKRSLGQGNIFAPVCHSVHKGVCLSACWDTLPHPLVADPLLVADPPPGSRHPSLRSACWELLATSRRYVFYRMHSCFTSALSENMNKEHTTDYRLRYN